MKLNIQLAWYGSYKSSWIRIRYIVFLSTGCTLGKSYRNSVHMYLFVFNSPTNWCKNYGERVCSFRVTMRFATMYFADRSHSSVRNYVTYQMECLPRLVWFILRPCQHDNGYIDGRSQIKVHTDERTQVHSAQPFTHPGTNRARRYLTSVIESPSKHWSPPRT